MTKLITVDPKKPDMRKIRTAARIIKNGGTVAFPTETVYGLGANALNSKAVKKIYVAKNRPADNPLIVHISNQDDLAILAKSIPPIVKKIIAKYWPGPLTIILEKSDKVPKITTGGQKTVAIRMPSNKIAQLLIKEAKTPIAAPSANLFGKPSPTKAEHVIEDLTGRVDLIIDGGDATIGIESTVVDFTEKNPMILRPGKITQKELEQFGKILIDPSLLGKKRKKIVAKSPGMKYRHYSPDAKIIIVRGDSKKAAAKIKELALKFRTKDRRIAVLSTRKQEKIKSDLIIYLGKNKDTIAKNLYAAFRKCDQKNIDIILSRGSEETGIGFAVMNRMKKAAYKIITV